MISNLKMTDAYFHLLFQIFLGSQKNFEGSHELNYDLSIFRSLKYLEVCFILIFVFLGSRKNFNPYEILCICH